MSTPVIHTRSVPSCVLWLEFNPLVACICAWHANKAEGDAWAKRKAIPVTHGICGTCEAQMKREISG